MVTITLGFLRFLMVLALLQLNDHTTATSNAFIRSVNSCGLFKSTSSCRDRQQKSTLWKLTRSLSGGQGAAEPSGLIDPPNNSSDVKYVVDPAQVQTSPTSATIPAANDASPTAEPLTPENIMNQAPPPAISVPSDTSPSQAVKLPPVIAQMLDKYHGRVVHCIAPQNPNCDIFLCGTLHVAQTSSDMVKDVISILHPQYVVLELCGARIDNLIERDESASPAMGLWDVIKTSLQEKSVKVLGMGLMSWMQVKAAKIVGNKLGGELAAAAKAGAQLNAVLVLGDRQYGVTIQRLMDRLRWTEKLKILVILVWEVLTMSFFKLKEYIHRTETDDKFIHDELEKFAKYLPGISDIIINERDDYLAQTLCDIARVGFRWNSPPDAGTRGCVVAVVGAGHLRGIAKNLAQGGVSAERIQQISSSSVHASTWPGPGMLEVVNVPALFPNLN